MMNGLKGLISMRCKSCGGTLKLLNGGYECENCHNRYEILSVYENTEVAICYTETDDFGRRTKDSIVAQEIYSKLSSLNINTFYQRISLGDLSPDTAEIVYANAKENAKILILLAGSKEYFSKLIDQNKNLLSKKKIIPIYFDIDAYDLPSELSAYQALNFNNVAAIKDVEKNILISLGRSDEIVSLETSKKKISKKKKILSASIVIIIFILLASTIYFIFGTSYVLPSKKYEQAEQLISEQKYVEAIDVLDSLEDYKNSQNLLENIYSQYIGYYHDDESNISLHLNTTGALRADVTITEVASENIVIKITESASINKDIVSFEYNDSQNNHGSVVIKLKNNGIDLSISSNYTNEKNIFFDISNKSDQPILKKIDRETLLNWLDTKISMSQIKALGYEIEEYSLMERDGLNRWYRIKNTDIILAMFGIDISKGEERNYGHNRSDRLLFGIMAPAEIICPDDIGKEYTPFIEENVLYWPDGSVGESGKNGLSVFWNYEDSVTNEISKKTTIAITSKKILTSNIWEGLLNDVLEAKTELFARDYYGLSKGEDASIEYIYENNNYILFKFFCDSLREQNSYSLFKINKTNEEIIFIGDVPSDDFYNFENYELGFYYPELLDEFEIVED